MLNCDWYYAWWAYHHKWDIDTAPDYIDRPTEEAALRNIRTQSQAAFILRQGDYLDRKFYDRG